MTLKDITIELEYAIKLNELGVKVDSLFYRNRNTGKVRSLIRSCDTGYIYNEQSYKETEIRFKEKVKNGVYIPAYTTDELLGMFVYSIEYKNKYYYFKRLTPWNQFMIGYYNCDGWGNASIESVLGKYSNQKEDDKNCNQYAKFLIFVLENKLMELPK